VGDYNVRQNLISAGFEGLGRISAFLAPEKKLSNLLRSFCGNLNEREKVTV